jgi:threonine-phosphate decarboxylase
MHEKGIKLANLAINNKKITGLDKSCEYLPCHDNLEDCTFCYCPFYPCNNPISGGKMVISSRTGKEVWDCSKCLLPHKTKNAQIILDELLKLNTKFEDIPRKTLLEIHEKILELDEEYC